MYFREFLVINKIINKVKRDKLILLITYITAR
jgi:hypothetical protein